MRRVILTTFIVLGIVAVAMGIGFAGFRFGVNYGIAQSPQVAEALQNLPEGGPGFDTMRPFDGHGFGMRPGFGYYGRGWGSFGFLQCLVPLFFLFFVFALFRFVFRPWGWGWRHGSHGGPGPWSKEGVPPHFEEWHKRAHGQTPPPADNPPTPNA